MKDMQFPAYKGPTENPMKKTGSKKSPLNKTSKAKSSEANATAKGDGVSWASSNPLNMNGSKLHKSCVSMGGKK